jgi:hypothetical protein
LTLTPVTYGYTYLSQYAPGARFGLKREPRENRGRARRCEPHPFLLVRMEGISASLTEPLSRMRDGKAAGRKGQSEDLPGSNGSRLRGQSLISDCYCTFEDKNGTSSGPLVGPRMSRSFLSQERKTPCNA